MRLPNLIDERVWSRLSPFALVPLRLFFGAAMMTHGYPKLFDAGRLEKFTAGVAELGFPLPGVFALLAALAELAGGALVLLGLFTRAGAAAIAVTMLVAGLWAHAADPFVRRELALTFMFVALAFVVLGAGRVSVDAWWSRRRRVRAGAITSTTV